MFFPNVCSKKVVRAYVVKVSVKQQCCVCVMFGYNNKLFRSFAHFFFSRVRARGATILALWVVKYESAIEWDRHALSWVNVCAIIFLVLWNRYSFTLKWTLTAPYKTKTNCPNLGIVWRRNKNHKLYRNDRHLYYLWRYEFDFQIWKSAWILK